MKRTFNIIHSFDPGGRTGYIKYDRENLKILDHKILIGYEQVGNVLDCIDFRTEMVVYEKAVGKMTVKSQFDMCLMVGFIQGFCEWMGIHNIGQAPSSRAGLKRLAKRYIKEHLENYEVHNIDAFVHILVYISKYEGIEEFK